MDFINKHIAFIVTNFYPQIDAVGNCVKNVADLLKINNKVDIYCIGGDDSDNYSIEVDGLNVRVCTSKFLYKQRNSHIFCKFIYRLARFVDTVCSRNLIRKDIYNTLINNLLKEDYDAIIPCMYPLEGVLASLEYKRGRKVCVIPYLFDNFVECSDYYRLDIFRRIHYNSNLELMGNIISESDSIVATHGFKPFFDKNFKNTEIVYVEHPVLKNHVLTSFKKTEKKGDCLTFIYAGSLVRNYIMADTCIKYMEALSSKINVKMLFRVAGNATGPAYAAANLKPTVFTTKGHVPREVLQRELQNTDIMISIAEKSGLQFSSKIFDYISAGKPIIHFYTYDDDINMKVLKRYPNQICIKDKGFVDETDLLKIEDFVKNNISIIIDYETTSAIFPDALPKYTSDLFIKLIEK